MALCRALAYGHEEAALAIIEDPRASRQLLTATFPKVGTPILIAAETGQERVVKALLERGADASSNAFIAAVAAGQVGVLNALVDWYTPPASSSFRVEMHLYRLYCERNRVTVQERAAAA